MVRVAMPVGVKRVCIALVTAALLLLAVGTAPAQSAGTVVGISGACFVVRGGSRTALRPGYAVQAGDILDVAVSGRLKLRMTDGSVVSAASGTRITIRVYPVDAAGRRQDASLSLGQGLLRAVVAPIAGPARFEVETATGLSRPFPLQCKSAF